MGVDSLLRALISLHAVSAVDHDPLLCVDSSMFFRGGWLEVTECLCSFGGEVCCSRGIVPPDYHLFWCMRARPLD